MARGKPLAIVAALIPFLISPSAASACSCVADAPLCETYWKAGVVFSGVVSDISAVRLRGEQHYRRRVRFRVEQTWRGTAATEVYTGLGGGDCGFRFVRGERYLVFADIADGRAMTSICSSTGPALMLAGWSDPGASGIGARIAITLDSMHRTR